MPIWLRKFTYQKIKDHYDKQNQSIKESQTKSSNTKEVIGTDGMIKAPEFLKKTSYK